MKNFFQFLTETTATQQAARLGLQGDGHGGWYKDGEFVAKTEKGRLKFYNKRQASGAKDPKQTDLEKNVSDPNFVDPSLQQQQAPVDPNAVVDPNAQIDPATGQPVQAAPPVNYLPVEKTKGTLTVAFGRFNPPHLGHLQLMDTAAAAAQQDQGDYMIVPSRSQDKKKNPLDPDTKVSLMRQIFPQHSERIANDTNTKTIFDVLKKAHNDGYTNVRIVGGADRVKEFNKLANNYNGNLYQFDNIEVVSAGDRDPDSEGVEGLSASRMRLAAAEGDFKTFRAGMPPEMRPKDAKAVFDTVRQAMGVQDQVVEVWDVAPKLDQKTLRENYLMEKIFNIGQLVENLNTGLVGRIIRRGTNYLICVTEDHIMFKSWIKDVMEAYQEKRVDSKMRLPGKPNTLVGTTGYLRYAAQQTPGAEVGKENLAYNQKGFGLNFINKYRKSK
jgi:phosphopantetheine adenylyltransferase